MSHITREFQTDDDSDKVMLCFIMLLGLFLIFLGGYLMPFHLVAV